MRHLPLLALFAALAGCTTDSGNGSSSSGSGSPGPARTGWSVDRGAAAVDDGQARFAQDWQEAVVTEGGGQRLWLRNAVRPDVSGKPVGPDDGALDVAGWIAFRAPEAGARPEREFVEWFTVRDEAAEKSVDAAPALAAKRDGRPLFALHRRVWRLGDVDAGMKVLDARLKSGVPIVVEPADSTPLESGKPRPALFLLSDKVMATGLVSWNIEVYDPDQKDPYLGFYFELDLSKAYPQASMPIGAAAPSPVLPRKLRVTGRVPDPDAKGCGRVVQREGLRTLK
ncbi:MAG: hypothetical protein K8T20_11630 [Planctomycetes bacterium]|nr:hypothetical protein [Planctomycetota bacterium]